MGFFCIVIGRQKFDNPQCQKNIVFFANLAVIFLSKNFKFDIKNFQPYNEILNDLKYEQKKIRRKSYGEKDMAKFTKVPL